MDKKTIAFQLSLFLVSVEFLECAESILSFRGGDFLGFDVNLHYRSSIEIVLGDGRPLG